MDLVLSIECLVRFLIFQKFITIVLVMAVSIITFTAEVAMIKQGSRKDGNAGSTAAEVGQRMIL